MSRVDVASRARRDLPQLETLDIAAINAGSGSDPAQDLTICALPDLKNAWLPLGWNEGVQQSEAINRMWVRYLALSSDGGSNTVGNATNFCDLIVRVYRAVGAGAAGVLQGAIGWMSLQCNTQIGTAVTAGGAAQTVTPATGSAMTGIFPGVQLYCDSGGTNPELVTVLSVTSTTYTAYYRYAHTSSATLTSILLTKRQVMFTPCLAVLPGTTLPAIASTGSQAVTPNANNGVNGMYGIHVNDSLLVDTVASGKQETVLVTAVSATQLTANFANTHGSATPIVATGAAGLSGASSVNMPYEIIEGDVIAFARRSNNATGLATPAGLITLDWINSHNGWK